jgi:hypothetical protein
MPDNFDFDFVPTGPKVDANSRTNRNGNSYRGRRGGMSVRRGGSRGRGGMLTDSITHPVPTARSTPASTGAGITGSSASDRSMALSASGGAVGSASGARGQEGDETGAGTGSSRMARRRPDPATEPHRYLAPAPAPGGFMDHATLPQGAGWANSDYLCPHCFDFQTQHAPRDCPNKCATCLKKHPTEASQ